MIKLMIHNYFHCVLHMIGLECNVHVHVIIIEGTLHAMYMYIYSVLVLI